MCINMTLALGCSFLNNSLFLSPKRRSFFDKIETALENRDKRIERKLDIRERKLALKERKRELFRKEHPRLIALERKAGKRLITGGKTASRLFKQATKSPPRKKGRRSTSSEDNIFGF